jgi:DnaJ-class molecular chaperone
MRNKTSNSQTAVPTSHGRMQASGADMLHPGDEAARGTPGTGEDVCPECHGKGCIGRSPCPTCGGTGTIIRGIGGA